MLLVRSAQRPLGRIMAPAIGFGRVSLVGHVVFFDTTSRVGVHGGWPQTASGVRRWDDVSRAGGADVYALCISNIYRALCKTEI